MRWLLATSLLFGAVAVAQEAAETQPRVGLGLGHGGGGVIGIFGTVYLPSQVGIDVGIHRRVAITNNLSYNARAITLGAHREHGWGGARPGYFVKAGGALGGEYSDLFVAGGAHLGLWTGNQRHVFTLQLGPGVFLVRDIPDYDPGPPLLLLVGASWQVTFGAVDR